MELDVLCESLPNAIGGYVFNISVKPLSDSNDSGDLFLYLWVTDKSLLLLFSKVPSGSSPNLYLLASFLPVWSLSDNFGGSLLPLLGFATIFLPNTKAK